MTISLKSYLDSVLKDMDQKDLLSRRKAADYFTQQLRKNIGGRGKSSPGGLPSVHSGNLRKSIGYKTTELREVLAGMYKGKGSHAHLVEHGHSPVKAKSRRPFFGKTWEDSLESMKDIMSEQWF